MVGTAARMRVSSVILPSASRGTLKSTRTSARFPAQSMSRIVFLFILPTSYVSPRVSISAHGRATPHGRMLWQLYGAAACGAAPILAQGGRPVNRSCPALVRSRGVGFAHRPCA